MAVASGQDVVVLGAGMSGMCAAIRAADLGARVTILEKGPDAMHSNTAFAGGGWAVFVQPYGPYTVDRIVEGLTETSHGLCDATLARAIVERMPDDFAWLRDEVRLPMHSQKDRVSGDGQQWGSFMTEGKGAAIPPHMLRQVEQRGIHVHFNSPARKLLADERGRVYGVRALNEDGPHDYEASAVVIATGSFEANGAMVLQYCGPEIFNHAYPWHVGPPTRTGDGHQMAMEVGASLMRYPWLAHCSAEYRRGDARGRDVVGPSPIRVLRQAYRWGIWINRQGRRFIDETMESDPISTAIVRQPGGVAALVFDSRIRERFAEEFVAYEQVVPGAVARLESLQELASLIGAPLHTLERTLEDYNCAVREDGRALDAEVPKGRDRPCAARIESPPYYVIYPLYGCLNTIWGGLELSTRMEVLDRDGRPIPNLYAAGSLFGGVFYGEWFQYPSGTWGYTSNHDTWGSSLPTCLVTGRIAGESAAGARQ